MFSKLYSLLKRKAPTNKKKLDNITQAVDVKAQRKHAIQAALKYTNDDPHQFTVTCDLHIKELVKWYCREHDATVCIECIGNDHPTCELDYVPNLCHDFSESDEYKQFNESLDNLLGRIELHLVVVDKSIEVTKVNGKLLVEEIEDPTESDTDHDIAVKEFMAEVEDILEQDIKTLQETKDNYEDVRLGISNIKYSLRKPKDDRESFIVYKRMTNRLKTLDDRVNRFEKQKKKPYFYIFRKAETMQLGKYCIQALGTIYRDTTEYNKAKSEEDSHKLDKTVLNTSESGRDDGTLNKPESGEKNDTLDKLDSMQYKVNSNVKDVQSIKIVADDACPINWRYCCVSPLKEIDIHCTFELYEADVTGLVYLEPHIIVLVDHMNDCIKEIDTESGSILTYIQLLSTPVDICLFDDNRKIAVTLPQKHLVQVYSTHPELAHIYSIPVGGNCYGIYATSNGLLAVSCSKAGRIEVLDPSGNRVYIKSTSDMPGHIVVTKEGLNEFIYVSNLDSNTIAKLFLKGEAKYTFQDAYDDIRGLCVTGDGHLLACDGWSDTIQLISSNATTVRTLITDEDGISGPCSLCYFASNRLLFIGGHDNVIKIFHVQ